MSIHAHLKEAKKNGAVLRVKYYGGTQPGAVREIYPREITLEYLSALCLATGITKTYIIRKMELCEGQELTYKPANILSHETYGYASLSDFYKHNKATLEKLGWHVRLDSNSISLCKYFKNGKPRKGSVVSLHYEKYRAIEIGIDKNGNVDECTESKRPWTVRAYNMNTRTYGNLGKAAVTFMDQAKLLAVDKNKT